MWSVKVSQLFVLLVCAWSVTVSAEPAQDGNEPWIAAEHLVPGWQSMALTAEYSNPEQAPGAYRPPRRSLLFSGEIKVIDPNGLIGLSTCPMDVLAFDEIGARIAVVRVIQSTPLYQPVRYTTTIWVPTGERRVAITPYDFSIDMRMRADAPFPTVLSRVEWSMDALLSNTFEMVDIPFVPTDGWIELAPGWRSS